MKTEDWEKELEKLINFRGDISPDNAIDFIRNLLAKQQEAKKGETKRIAYSIGFKEGHKKAEQEIKEMIKERRKIDN